MDVTPPPGLYKVMLNLTDAFIGEEPLAIETTRAANDRREARRKMMDILHNIVRLSMRVGVARYRTENGLPVVEDSVRPDPVLKMVRDDRPESAVVQTSL
jgi:hypothetical protein